MGCFADCSRCDKWSWCSWLPDNCNNTPIGEDELPELAPLYEHLKEGEELLWKE